MEAPAAEDPRLERLIDSYKDNVDRLLERIATKAQGFSPEVKSRKNVEELVGKVFGEVKHKLKVLRQ